MRQSSLFLILVGLLSCGTFLSANDKVSADLARSSDDGKTLWFEIQHLGLEGQGWQETKSPFDRLPAKAEGVVRKPVWNLSRHSAGISVRFATDAKTIEAKWTLTSSNLAMPHMPATGVSGLDLYVKTPGGSWRWVANGRPTRQSNELQLLGEIPTGRHEFCLYLPLYNGVTSVEIGIPTDAELARLPRTKGTERPIVFYGTSITHGGCASRPGMVHTSILGRRLNRPVINLGFSGNGTMDLEMAELLAELDASMYVIDCLPNMEAELVRQRVKPLVEQIRSVRPNVPIVLAEDRTYSNSFFIPSKKERNDESRVSLRETFEQLLKAGVKNLLYLEGEGQLGDDGEATVDSSHPTDLGFMRMADAFEPVMRQALKINN
ncbi:MAG TPA: SGNH/GDSL hydrolase family protein [Pirellulaceae bacterium]|nr:SGNH/GDSL hydrolase family protein [Pirellulaceae bacterium]